MEPCEGNLGKRDEANLDLVWALNPMTGVCMKEKQV
jgi:hypothetical protein